MTKTQIAPLNGSGLDYSVRVSCGCRTCKANAEKVGAPFPLSALVNTKAAANMGIKDGSREHGIVHMAHDPRTAPYQIVAIAVTA